MTFRTVRAIGLRIPGAEESTMYGAPALKIGGRMFACIASHSSAEPNTLVVLMDFAQRDALLAEDPDTYYLKDHYVNYPCVLVRLSRVHEDAIEDLLAGAARFTDRAKNAEGAKAAKAKAARAKAAKARR